ncbi:response regulator transcription factor [Streptomyces sp. NPDC002125]
MTHPLQTAIRTQLLAVAEERDLAITTTDVAALAEAALTAVLSTPRPASPVQLTNQQLGVLIGLARGDAERDTARRMCISPFTVKSHRQSLYKALGVTSAGAAVATAMSYGLLRPGLHAAPLSLPGQREAGA